MGAGNNVLTAVNDVLTARGTALDRLKPSTIRAKMLQHMTFRALVNVNGEDPDSPWPLEDPYIRYGIDQFAQDAPIIWFEPLPPMLPNLEEDPKLPPCGPDTYTLVLDLDETLVHYYEHDGLGNYHIRPGMHEFLERMNSLGYELVIFTAATQDYADWVIDQIDPGKLIHYRLYRQHALPWGPIFVKDMSRLGRDLDRTLMIDNVQENFMLQPNNGIFIMTWYDDAHDTALFALTPLLDELIATRSKVPEILEKYRDQIPTWAGFDQYSQLGGEYSEFDPPPDDSPSGQEEPDMYGQDSVSSQNMQPATGPGQVPQPQQHYHQHVVQAPEDQAWDLQEEQHVAPGGYQATQSSYTSHADLGPAAAPAPAAPYVGRYHQQTPPAPAPAAAQAPYSPQPRMAAPQPPAPQQQQQPQPQGLHQQQYQQPAHQPPQAATYQQPQYQQAPPHELQQQHHPAAHQPQARPAAVPQAAQGVPRPAFSASGVAGPYQAAQSQPQMHQPVHAPAPATAWSRAGGAGPLQAVRHR